MKSMRVRWAGRVARVGAKGSTYKVLVGKPDGNHYEDLDVGGWIMLKWILEKWGGVGWYGLD
jgi:hypothetical protein